MIRSPASIANSPIADGKPTSPETPNSTENGHLELDDLGHVAGRGVGHQASAAQIWAMRAILSPNVTMPRSPGRDHQDVADSIGSSRGSDAALPRTGLRAKAYCRHPLAGPSGLIAGFRAA
jgi:hypothetical protein